MISEVTDGFYAKRDPLMYTPVFICILLFSCYLSLCRNQSKYILGNVDLSVESGQLSCMLVEACLVTFVIISAGWLVQSIPIICIHRLLS